MQPGGGCKCSLSGLQLQPDRLQVQLQMQLAQLHGAFTRAAPCSRAGCIVQPGGLHGAVGHGRTAADAQPRSTARQRGPLHMQPLHMQPEPLQVQLQVQPFFTEFKLIAGRSSCTCRRFTCTCSPPSCTCSVGGLHLQLRGLHVQLHRAAWITSPPSRSTCPRVRSLFFLELNSTWRQATARTLGAVLRVCSVGLVAAARVRPEAAADPRGRGARSWPVCEEFWCADPRTTLLRRWAARSSPPSIAQGSCTFIARC